MKIGDRFKMSTYFAAAVIVLFVASAALASEDCRIEGWNYKKIADKIYITGATTCREGRITIRVYDGSTDRFLVSGFTFIKGYAFQQYFDAEPPESIKIKYTVD
jgi:hypothetical protein